jgi:hypothetical protein
MNEKLIPTSLHWMIPIIAELADQRSRNVDEFALSEEHKELINRRLTTKLRKDIERWIGTTHSEEASKFLMAMIALDELGHLQPSEPILDFEHFRSELASQLWGHVRRAVHFIGEDFLADLTEEKRLDLDVYVEKILESTTNTNSRIWLTWLRCQIDKKLDIGRDFLRKIIDKSPGNDDEEFDLGEDACCALVSMPYVSKEDVGSVMRYIFRTDIDEFKAAVALEALLKSAHVTAEVKRHAKERARQTNRSELIDVVETT